MENSKIPPARILIVDDMPKNIQVLGTTLRQQNYQIYVAQDGLQAIHMAREVVPDLILLDVMMPGLDGFDTCKRLKENPHTRAIPVIFITAKIESGDVLQGFALGAVDYITKPFKAGELLARVHTHLELKYNRDLLARSNTERKELLHILCHDLANSLGAVLSLLELSDSPEDFLEMRGNLYSTTRNGLNLINLVREMRALEDHKLGLHPVNLSDALKRSAQVLQQRFHDKQIRLEIEVPRELRVYAEEISLINSVLNNLFTNAIKFSYPGSRILLTAQAGENTVELRIQDFGIGMSAKLLADVFDMGKATTRSGTQGERGTGFGMPLVKKFMEAYGGSLSIASQAEKDFPQAHGTTVTLSFKGA